MRDFTQSLGLRAAQGLARTRRVVAGPQGPELKVDGKSFLSFCSNDYLGLANHPDIVAASVAAAYEFGVGAGASALVCGHSTAHERLELELANFVDMPRALYFSNGYMANIGVITALTGAGDTVLVDHLVHASLIDGARLTRASFKAYPHNDLGRLQCLLAKCTSPCKLVVTDAVFSMDGDCAHLIELIALCRRYNAWVLVDDAHGFGVLGPHGSGSLAHFGLRAENVIYVGTLGKAAGVAGAFVAASKDLIEWIMQRARTYMFTTANPPMLAAAASASLVLIARDEWRRAQLGDLGTALKQGLAGLRWRLLPSFTAIQPLIVGDNIETRKLASHLSRQGLWVSAICPPAVPRGTARLRISLSALHTQADVSLLVAALHRAAADMPSATRYEAPCYD